MHNHVKSTEDSWNKVPKTGSKFDVVSRLFRFSPVAPPSHHVRPVASVPSLGASSAVVVLRLDGGARGQQRLDHLQVAVPEAAKCNGPLPRSGGCRWRWRRDAPSRMSCFGGFRI